MMLLGVASDLQVLGWSLIATLLISTGIAAGVGGAGKRLTTPVSRYRAAAIGLLLLAAAPIGAFLALRLGALPPVVVWRTSNAEPWRTVLIAAVGAWAGGAAVLAAIHIGGWRRLQRLVRSSCSATCEVPGQIAAQLCARFGAAPDICITNDPLLTTPVAIGAIRPTILIPASVATNSTPVELRHLVAHEFAHVLRRDYATNCLRILLETLFWFTPAVWWLSRRLCIERECCCDDLAVRLCDEHPIRYARTLVALDERRHGIARLAPASTDGDLALRVVRLVGGPGAHRSRRGTVAWVAMLCAALVGLAGVRPILAAMLGTQPARKTTLPEREMTAPARMPGVHAPAESNGCS